MSFTLTYQRPWIYAIEAPIILVSSGFAYATPTKYTIFLNIVKSIGIYMVVRNLSGSMRKGLRVTWHSYKLKCGMFRCRDGQIESVVTGGKVPILHMSFI